MAKPFAGSCEWCGEGPIRETLDGECLCQGCCNLWARGEGYAAAQQEEAENDDRS